MKNFLQSIFAKHSNNTLIMRAIEISMGFVFFMGGWRRFFNDPLKHDIESSSHLAGKLVQAAGGSPIEPIIHWLLDHPVLTDIAVLFMSTGEIIVGAALIVGFMTRFAALGSAMLNVAMMLIFGWMGFECLDEWTMAALGFAVSVTIMINGSSKGTFDSFMGIDPFKSLVTKTNTIALIALSATFSVGFYSHYFGIFTLERNTSVSPFVVEAVPHEDANKTTLYVSGGGSSNPALMSSIDFTTSEGDTYRVLAEDIVVDSTRYPVWNKGSGKKTEGLMIMSLGSFITIEHDENVVSAKINIVNNKKTNILEF